VFGTREERVHVFQEYVSKRCSNARELPLLKTSPTVAAPERDVAPA
jgi:hypothetical protein